MKKLYDKYSVNYDTMTIGIATEINLITQENEIFVLENLNISIGGGLVKMIEEFYEELSSEIFKTSSFFNSFIFNQENLEDSKSKLKELDSKFTKETKQLKIELVNFNFKEDSFLYVYQDFKNFEEEKQKNVHVNLEKSNLITPIIGNNPSKISNNVITEEVYDSIEELIDGVTELTGEKLSMSNLKTEQKLIDYHSLNLIASCFDFAKMTQPPKQLKAFKNKIIFLIKSRDIIIKME